MDNPIAVWLLGMFPQVLLLIYAPVGLVGARITFGQVVLPGVILSVFVALTRFVPSLFGWHIPIFLAAYLVLARGFRLATWLGALAAASLSFVLVVLGDVLVAAPVLGFFRFNYARIVDSAPLYIAFAWLESVFLIAAAILVKRKGFVLIPVERFRAPGRAGKEIK